jgi:hypothetical protein
MKLEFAADRFDDTMFVDLGEAIVNGVVNRVQPGQTRVIRRRRAC